jgi:tetratricopeptide (TPR) repeat protein
MTVLAECISPSLEASGRQFRATLTPHINSCLQAFKAQFHTWPETLENAEIFERFAWVYAEQGTWKTARFWQQKVVDIRMKQLGRRHAQTVFAQSTLARTLWNLFEIGPAIELQLRVLHTLRWQRPSIKEWLAWPPWKPIHTPYCLALADITLTFWLAGKRQRSKQMGERAVDGLTKRLGPDDPKTLNAMFNLARTYLHIGEQEKSRELLVRVLRIQKHFFGLEHPDTMMTRNELGINLCASRRNLPIAERLIKNVYEARKKVLGEEHAYTLWSINDLSKVYMARGHVSKAVPMLEDTLSTAIRTLGDDHVGTSMTRSNLARGYFMMEKWEQAEELIRPSLQNTPQNHPDWVHNMYGYAQIKFNLGALDEAEQQCNIMLDVISKTKILGIHDSRTVAIADLLLSIYRLEGREKDIIAIKSKVPGTESTKNEDRYDPYAIRRSSHSSPAPKKKGKVAFVEAQPGNVEGERHRKSDAGFFQRERESRADEAASRTRPQLLSRRTF